MNGFHDLKSFLDIKADLYNRPEFIPSDPISIPHLFRQKEDIEIAGFLTAVISWGQRKTILASARSLMHLMDDNPFDFVMGSSAADQKSLMHFNHRTFNGSDCQYFILALRNLYTHHGGLEKPFISRYSAEPVDIKRSLHQLKETFFELPHMNRTRKHLPDPFKGSAAKRMNMFLRWMVRKDNRGVDFGIWTTTPQESLYCPLDIHSGLVARKIGILSRPYNDWKAVEELTGQLRLLDPKDPVRYDYALFGTGINENFP